ncbi:hypothetical protein DM02DRAFT_630973 [Periconia macrospinosa]|uniref:Uncharacterized protein n=1 Tax=Periconia macrospinosa TaxID=97972 RepID=A0A2V1DHH8_9PLEO|nr:hypothetical protein DM02DRAFT_630973 [Periconia macrospinosa]
MSPIHNQQKSRDLKRKQLISMWQITLLRSVLRKSPDKKKVAEITKAFDDMLEPEHREIYVDLRRKHRAVLADIKKGKDPEGAAKEDFEHLFTKIAVSLDMTAEQISIGLEGDEQYGRLITFYRHTLCRQIFGETSYPDLVKEAFVNELEHPLPYQFQQLQKKYGRTFYKRIGELEKEGQPTVAREQAIDMEEDLEKFFDKVAESMNIPLKEVLDMCLGDYTSSDEGEGAGSEHEGPVYESGDGSLTDYEDFQLFDGDDDDDCLTEMGDW